MRIIWALVGIVAIGGVAWTVKALAIETPRYTIERAEGDFELRAYPAMVAAEVTRTGDRDQAVRSAFVDLANYIFAKNRSGEKIAMTAPVTQAPEKIAMTAPVTQTGGAEGWTVRFLMPAGRTIASLPAPSGDVRLVDLPGAREAAVRFSGRWTDGNFAEAEARLKDWMGRQGLKAAGPATFAYYDPPFKPWFMRRNEVLIPVAP